MATVDVVNMEGKRVGELELSDQVFEAPVREHLLWEVVTAQRAAKRSGTACVKGRSEVRGSTKKLYKQKGTGRARHGSIRAPIYVGGGQVHGPQPRSYAKRTPKRVRRRALISAISLRRREAQLVIVDKLDFQEFKTKRAAEMLEKLGIRSGLVVEDAGNERAFKSMRNLPAVKCLAPEGVNVFDILKFRQLVMTTATAKKLEDRLLQD